MEILPIEISELQESGFDMGILSFSDKELTQLLNVNIEQGMTDSDSVPEPPEQSVTQKGDLWILGNHRLMCGDSASQRDVDRLLDGNTIQLFHGDPPYGVSVEPRSNNAIAAGVSSFPGENGNYDIPPSCQRPFPLRTINWVKRNLKILPSLLCFFKF
jgi:hypothetical protein